MNAECTEILETLKELLAEYEAYPAWAEIPPRIGSFSLAEKCRRVIAKAEGRS